MARYPLNLPQQLKRDAEEWAAHQGVSLNQFVVWAVSEKVGGLRQELYDPRFPHIVYRLGAARWPTPVVRGTGIQVKTLAVAHRSWGLDLDQLADEYELSQAVVENALAFYDAHRDEIDREIQADLDAQNEAEGLAVSA
ncbi:MAG: DUF433 domain-containing protein [Acidobacteriota bacterium]